MDHDRLFESTNPLEERTGSEFWEQLPTTPGVYRMYGGNGSLLYVGKAKNLRRRLFTYRRITPNSGSRKTRRLVRMTHRITIEELPDEQQALLRENELIRTEKPPFNRAKKAPETYYYISAVPASRVLTFDIRMHLREENRERTYGAFKGHRSVRRALGGLLRQLYIMEHTIDSPFHLPSLLLNRLTPMHYEVATAKKMAGHVHRFFEGSSNELLKQIADHASRHRLLEQFIGKLVLSDLEALSFFYDRSARRNRKIVQKLELDSHLIPQEKLDDYLVELAFAKTDAT